MKAGRVSSGRKGDIAMTMTKEILRLPQVGGVPAHWDAPLASEMPVRRDGMPAREWEYVHHVAARLRVRSARLRKDRNRADDIENTVKTIEGVTAVAVNLLTGSLTVIYEPKRVTPDAILGALRRHGFSAASLRRTRVAIAAPKDSAVREAGRAVLYLMLQHVMEQSVKAAWAALL
jgi:copper chaperone CopZ